MKSEVKIAKDMKATKYRALITKEYIIISDLHLGYESAMVSDGIFVPHYQYHEMERTLAKLAKAHAEKTVIVNGDTKHDFARSLRDEWNETHRLFKFLLRTFPKIIVVKGNHDNYLQSVASKYDGIEFHRNSFETDGLFVTHGHQKFSTPPGKIAVIGHEHPSVALRDDIGVSMKPPCFLYDEKLVVLPAFSPLAAGTDMVTCSYEDLLSSVLRKRQMDNVKVVAVDEYGCMELPELGKLREAR
jgi:putative SbcD/Mre11-related phosphoesterase